MINRELTEPKKGQYVVCKHMGDNGDLILGRIESVRSTGEVLLTNFLGKKRSVKSIRVLKARNYRATAAEVKSLMKLFLKTRDKQKVRLAAVSLRTNNTVSTYDPNMKRRQPIARVPSVGETLLSAYKNMPSAEKTVFKNALMIELNRETQG